MITMESVTEKTSDDALNIEKIVKEELETMYRLLNIMKPESEVEFINVMTPNLTLRLFHLLNKVNQN